MGSFLPLKDNQNKRPSNAFNISFLNTNNLERTKLHFEFGQGIYVVVRTLRVAAQTEITYPCSAERKLMSLRHNLPSLALPSLNDSLVTNLCPFYLAS